MSKVNYKKASTYYLVGNLFNKGMSFLTVPIFTRILSTKDYGIVTTYNSWIAILAMIIGFAIHMGIRASFVDYREEIDDFMSVTTTFTIFSGAIICLFVGLCSIFLNSNIMVVLVILCVLQGLASALNQNYSMYLMMHYRYKFRTALMVLPNLVSSIIAIFAILFVCKTNLYLGRIIPTALVTIGFAMITVVMVYKKSHVLFNSKYLKYALSISAPLVLHGIALNILSQSDRTMITWLADSSQTGIYSLIYNFSMLATVITTSLEGIWVPWFTEKLKKNDVNIINVKVQDYIKLISCSMFALVLIGPEIVKLLADRKYWDGISIIPPVLLANFLIFAYTLYVNIEHFYKKTVYITLNTVFAAGINLLLNYLFIPHYGYVAAAYTTLISYFIAFILHARYAKKIKHELYPLHYFLKSIITLLLAIVVFYMFINKPIIRWFIAILYLGLVLLQEKEKIKSIVSKKKIK